jgi:uncharacterized protein YndB with AHSA1/START domain/predicted SnoaL-like aldol condensation-catalyzing enzyme
MSTPMMTVKVTHRFEASAERVFDAWLDPAKAGKWLFATKTGKMIRAEIDARVGGGFVFVDRRDGEDVEHIGKYLELDRPRRIVFTFAVKMAPFTGDPSESTKVTIDIEPKGGGCVLTLTHEGVLRDYVERTNAGWTGILDGLERSLSRKADAIAFLELAASGRAHLAFPRFVGAGFIHHNAYFKGDADTLMKAMDEAAKENPGTIIEVQRALEDGDTVAVHSHVRHKPEDLGYATMHIFRFDADRVVELWDFGQEVPADSPNEHGMF